MARIEGVRDEEASFMTKRVFAAAAKEAGAVPDPLRIMAKSSPTMWGAGLLQVSLDRGGNRVFRQRIDQSHLQRRAGPHSAPVRDH